MSFEVIWSQQLLILFETDTPPFSRDPNLRHLTKNRPKLINRRLPSRFTAEGHVVQSNLVDSKSSKRLKQEKSASQIEEHLFSPEDQPVTV